MIKILSQTVIQKLTLASLLFASGLFSASIGSASTSESITTEMQLSRSLAMSVEDKSLAQSLHRSQLDMDQIYDIYEASNSLPKAEARKPMVLERGSDAVVFKREVRVPSLKDRPASKAKETKEGSNSVSALEQGRNVSCENSSDCAILN
jgi:long-subunit acyl-CoA synthetase (AMP-forming)